MCGIAALYKNTPISIDEIKRMTDIIDYRGPDGEGHHSFFDDRLWLGHRRLAIVDLSKAGHQPMSYGNGRYWITFNGEVYNFIELKDELLKLGHCFVSGTDTEVILAAYSQWGEDCLQRFNGMWAFVIVDVMEKKLFAARDRFGVKPLYYSLGEDSFGISSEIKQLVVSGFGNGKANREEVAKFLLYGDVNINRETLFEGICQVLPGEALFLEIDAGMSSIRHSKYYPLNLDALEKKESSWKEYEREFEDLITDSISLRLRSDVPVGSCLSGGLDSSTIVLTLSRLLENSKESQQKTFTSCFEDRRFDESDYAEAIAKATGAESHRIYPDMNLLLDDMQRMTWHQEEPFRSSSIYAQWNVMRLAKDRGIKVLLDGQGADEIMAGYHSYFPIYIANTLRELKLVSLVKFIKEMKKTGTLNATDSTRSLIIKSVYHLLNKKKYKQTSMKRLMKKAFYNINGSEQSVRLQERLGQDVFGSLQSLLRHEDRNSMAFSIEARTPFLDYRLVELCMRLPSKMKYKDGWTKPLLRNFNKGRMPDKVRLRIDKKGFVTPESVWYKEHFAEIKRILLEENSTLFEWIDKEQLEQYLQGKNTNRSLVWRLLSTHFWLKCYQLR